MKFKVGDKFKIKSNASEKYLLSRSITIGVCYEVIESMSERSGESIYFINDKGDKTFASDLFFNYFLPLTSANLIDEKIESLNMTSYVDVSSIRKEDYHMLIDFSIEINDKEWFIDLTNRLKEFVQ